MMDVLTPGLLPPVVARPLPRELRLGRLRLASPAVQAALSGYSDLPMRRVARHFGAAFTINEVVLDEHVLRPGKLQRDILNVPDDLHPAGAQLLGAFPDTFAAAARLLVDAGYDAVDINFGCPVKKVLGRCRGGYLLSDPHTALQIVARVRDAVPEPVPVTVKMRRGMDDSAESEEKFWQIFEGAFEAGINAVCVHGRTVKQRYVGSSRWAFLAEVKRRHPDKTVLGSGDVFTALDAVRMLAETGVDGVWCARGSIGAPWIFQQIARVIDQCSGAGLSDVAQAPSAVRDAERRSLAHAAGSSESLAALTWDAVGPPPDLEMQREALAMHLAEAQAAYGDERGGRMFRKFGIKYSEAHPAGRTLRDAFIACRDVADLYAVLDRWYPVGLAARAELLERFGPIRHREGPGDLVAAGACGEP